MNKVGFTGTQKGMTNKQKLEVRSLILSLEPTFEYHHGDCIGADEDFHKLVNKPELTVIHPPVNNKKRAFCKAEIALKPKEYLIRNKDIVNDTDILIATPKSNKESLRSGTWSTIRYAKNIGKTVIIIFP